jgi:hypothetical protein
MKSEKNTLLIGECQKYVVLKIGMPFCPDKKYVSA